jgi:hypothetical protein
MRAKRLRSASVGRSSSLAFTPARKSTRVDLGLPQRTVVEVMTELEAVFPMAAFMLLAYGHALR